MEYPANSRMKTPGAVAEEWAPGQIRTGESPVKAGDEVLPAPVPTP